MLSNIIVARIWTKFFHFNFVMAVQEIVCQLRTPKTDVMITTSIEHKRLTTFKVLVSMCDVSSTVAVEELKPDCEEDGK